MDEFAFRLSVPPLVKHRKLLRQVLPGKVSQTLTSTSMPGLGKEGDKARAEVAITVPEQDQQILCQNSSCVSCAEIQV